MNSGIPITSLSSLDARNKSIIESLLSEYRSIRSNLKPLESAKEVLQKQISQLCRDLYIVNVPNQISIIRGRKTISRALLIEHNVSADIIDACTIEGEPFYRILNGIEDD